MLDARRAASSASSVRRRFLRIMLRRRERLGAMATDPDGGDATADMRGFCTLRVSGGRLGRGAAAADDDVDVASAAGVDGGRDVKTLS